MIRQKPARARLWRFFAFAGLLSPEWYNLPPGLFRALKIKIRVKFGNTEFLP